MGWVSSTLYHFYFVFTQLLYRVLSQLYVLNVLLLTELFAAVSWQLAGIVNTMIQYLACCYVV